MDSKANEVSRFANAEQRLHEIMLSEMSTRFFPQHQKESRVEACKRVIAKNGAVMLIEKRKENNNNGGSNQVEG